MNLTMTAWRWRLVRMLRSQRGPIVRKMRVQAWREVRTVLIVESARARRRPRLAELLAVSGAVS